MVPSAILTAVALTAIAAHAQPQPGRTIGTVTTRDKLIVLELDTGVIAPEHLFDLDHRTLRFTPDGAGYRIENVPLVWDAAFGDPAPGGPVVLRTVRVPFSGRQWDTLAVQTGTITFGAPVGGGGVPRGGGFRVDRFAELRVAAGTLVNQLPGIAAFLKPRMSGPRYVKELADRVVVTWTLTEPSGGIFDFTWVPTVNRVQAVLHADGVIELSYDGVAARDAIVGVYPLVTAGVEAPLASLNDPEDAALPANVDVTGVRLAAVDGVFLKATIETRGPVLPADSGALAGRVWRVALDPRGTSAASVAGAPIVWTVRAVGRGQGGGGPTPRFVASGPGVSGEVAVSGNTITVRGTLPASLVGAKRLAVVADAAVGGPGGAVTAADTVAPLGVSLGALRPAEIDLSSARKSAGAYPVAFESFHHAALPRTTDMACTVIRALGDRFDFFVWYSDFRVDNQEAGTPSTGPRGGDVRGIGPTMRGLENYCSQGRLQWMYVQPVFVGSLQGQERSPDGRVAEYNYAMSQVGHELGHRWTADARATVNGETFDLGPVHWARGLQAPAAFPYTRPVEASLMGGGVWRENEDGTWAQLDDDFFVPATGYSWLDLYLMGLARPDEVPPFFLLRRLAPTGARDTEGHALYRGERTPVTIADVVAAMGPRLPAEPEAQKAFNTGVVVLVQHGRAPSRELVERANGIREHWMAFWGKSTGGRSTMTTDPR